MTEKISQMLLASNFGDIPPPNGIIGNTAIETQQQSGPSNISRKMPAGALASDARTFVISDSIADPPLFIAEGSRYLIAAPATGDWTGLEGYIAEWLLDGSGNGAWWITRPKGLIYILSTKVLALFNNAGQRVNVLFTSAPIAIAAGLHAAGAHLLGAVPVTTGAFLICDSDANGYVAGQTVAIAQAAGAANSGVMISATSTALAAIIGNAGIAILDAATFNSVQITDSAHFHLLVWARKI